MPERYPRKSPTEPADPSARETDSAFRQLAENIDAVFWLYDIDAGRTIYVSPASERILGVPVDVLRADPQSALRLVHPDDRDRVFSSLPTRVSGRYDIEYRSVRANGEVRWIRDRGFPIRDESGRAYRAAGIAEDVTEWRRAEQERAAAETHYRRLVATAPQTIYALDAEGRFTELNEAGEVLLGRSAEELMGRTFDGMFDPEDLPAANAVFARLMSGREDVVEAELEIQRPSGERRRVLVRAAAVREDGRVVGTHGVARDITDERAAQRELRNANLRLAQILATSPTILYTLRIDGALGATPLWVSENITPILGYDAADVLSPGWWPDNLHPEDRPGAFEAFLRVSARRTVSHEYRFRHADGTWRWVHDELRVVSENGGVREVVGSWTDITEAHTSRLLLQESELSYQSLFNSLSEMVCIMDLAGIVLDVNDAVLARTAYTREELVGHVPAFLAELRDDEEQELAACYERAVEGHAQRTRLMAVTKSGERFPAELSFVRGRHFGRDVMITVGQDITERVGAEHALRSAESHYRRLVENSPSGIFMLDGAGRFIEINPAGLELLARTFEQVMNRPMAEVIHPDDLDMAAEWLRLRMLGDIDVSDHELRIVRPSGEARVLNIRATAVVEDGRVIGTHGVARDITEDRRNEQQLRRAERLATIGTLIGGVAHELNNPLQAINNFAALLLEDAHTEQERDDLETIRREAARAAKIVADLRLFARDTQEVLDARTAVDMNDIVRHVLRTRRYSLETRNIELREDLGTELPAVAADAGDMEQVLINLIVNAEQAMDAIDAGRVLIVRTRATGMGIALHVVDNGPGIPREFLDHIFDPFFTTKSRTEGTGLGLSLVHKIVSEHGGEIHAESEVGRGAAFHIHLPAAPITHPVAPAASTHATLASRPLRILIVDDEPAVRSAVARFLKRRGHDVDVAAEGAEALRILEADGGYDIVLSDLRMPGLGGDQLLARLRERGEGIDRRLMFLTGEAAGGRSARMLAESAAPVIFKPIELAELAQRIEQHADVIREE